MPEEKSLGQVPEASGQEPQDVQVPQGGETPGQEPERFDAEYIRKLRAEAAEYRKKLRELEAVVKQNQEAKLSEAERLQKRLAELEHEREEWARERQERTLRYETMLTAQKLGIVDPDAAWRLLDLKQIEFDEDGQPQNVEKVLRDLIRARPYLAGGPSASPTNPARSASRLTLEEIRRMTPEEINRRWDEVREVLKRSGM